MVIDPAAAVERLAELRERERLKKRRQREKRKLAKSRIPGTPRVDAETLGSVPGMVGADLEGRQALPVQARPTGEPSTQQPPRQREIKVRRPGVAPEGPDEISHDDWEKLGRSTERLREFLRQRDTAQRARGGQLGGQ
jgi:hypothetical protein